MQSNEIMVLKQRINLLEQELAQQREINRTITQKWQSIMSLLENQSQNQNNNQKQINYLYQYSVNQDLINLKNDIHMIQQQNNDTDKQYQLMSIIYQLKNKYQGDYQIDEALKIIQSISMKPLSNDLEFQQMVSWNHELQNQLNEQNKDERTTVGNKQ
ncbi:hypothetical protein pb186bvf_014344 [Paramecium bursaria]